ncbi:DUF2007 domain-containing protein [Rhodoligotrophos ferricapiens]|uniref:putative signal transducing protein n=1 Tax=Rhodoligotrophos ferricapiens TaxID=3069264 RepID=UPI00315CC82B
MREILRSNDMVALSFATALLKDAGIDHIILDTNMSVVEGSLGILPRRLMVVDEEVDAARQLLRDAGLSL